WPSRRGAGLVTLGPVTDHSRASRIVLSDYFAAWSGGQTGAARAAVHSRPAPDGLRHSGERAQSTPRAGAVFAGRADGERGSRLATRCRAPASAGPARRAAVR